MHFSKFLVPTILVALISSQARAQTTERINQERLAAPFAKVQGFGLLQNRPVKACFYTGVRYQGFRACFDPPANPDAIVPFDDPFKSHIVSFNLPYGYEMSLYKEGSATTLTAAPELLCTFRNRSRSRYTFGVDALQSAAGEAPDLTRPYDFSYCLGPNQRADVATRFSFKKIADITDAQRAAVWENWEQNDRENCAFRVYPSMLVQTGPQPNPRRPTQSDRSRCYGFRHELTDLAQIFHDNERDNPITLKDDFAQLRISSRYSMVQLGDRANFGGKSLILGCGDYQFSQAMSRQIAAAHVMILTNPAVSCAQRMETISSWDRPRTPIPPQP
jgi:hypothetical protein